MLLRNSWIPLALFLLGCAGAPSRYVIVDVPPSPWRGLVLPPNHWLPPWPPRDEHGGLPIAWCQTTCARVRKSAERTKHCRLVETAWNSWHGMEALACEFE
jgi:hypothetical protein